MFRLKYLPHREPDEKIVFFLRRHWAILLGIVLFYAMLAIIPLVLIWLSRRGVFGGLENEILIIFLNLLLFVYYLFWWMFFYHAWLDYFLDIWIVTNNRVINIEQRGLFYRVVAEQKLFRIQDVLSEQKGMIPTLFNYGQVHIQTAGTEKTAVFEQVANPQYIAQEIIKLVERHKERMVKVMEMENIDET